jgi:phosphoglycolate phosphatase
MRLAVFDVDGTLVNSRAMITASLAAAFASEKIAAPPEDRMLSIVGLSLAEAMRQLLPEETEERHHRLAAAYKEAFWTYRASNAHAEQLFDGALALLQRLRAREDVLLGIATGKSERGIRHFLQRHGLEDWFATIQTSDNHPSKPHPAMLRQALADTGIEARQAVMIGDTSFDIAMARAAGMQALGVTWGNHPRVELERAGAHFIINHFNELEHCLEFIWQDQAG